MFLMLIISIDFLFLIFLGFVVRYDFVIDVVDIVFNNRVGIKRYMVFEVLSDIISMN